ncbi:MAG: pentapeptide repeat-containing protein [Actinomycetota bacterium]|nr:pentapeptide repeat-containing protein [Actinomycetota bacterium]
MSGPQFTDQQDLTRRGQIADRFTKAIDELGQQGPDKLDIRLGGIYALEQIARDSKDNGLNENRRTTYELLAAYVREHAAWKGNTLATREPLSALPELRPEIQTIMTVLARRNRSPNDQDLDLRGTDLRKVQLPDGDLEQLNLTHANLHGANLVRADLKRSTLDEVQLEEAVLVESHLDLKTLAQNATLVGANLTFAHLERCNLNGAHLEGAYLNGARLADASLIGAHLEAAHLDDANLERAELEDTHLEAASVLHTRLTKAKANRLTAWPTGFDSKAAGIQMVG